MRFSPKLGSSFVLISILAVSQGCSHRPADHNGPAVSATAAQSTTPTAPVHATPAAAPAGPKQPAAATSKSAVAAKPAPAPAAKPAIEPPANPPTALTAAEARELGIEAYLYGYPLVTMEMTRRVMTNVAAPEGSRAPMGRFVKMRSYPTAAFRDVTAPNADTLYTIVWLDLAKEPWIIGIPDLHDRYALFPMLSGWTDVFEAPGKRTTGTKAQKYALTGPGWKGKLPAGVAEYKSPTNLVWFLGRIYCTGTPQDYKEVHALQDKFTAVPLSSYGEKYTPPQGQVDPRIDMQTAVRDQVNHLDAAAYFQLLAALMKTNPPAAADAPLIAKLAKLGIVPGRDFDAAKLDPATARALDDVPKLAIEKIAAAYEAMKPQQGWVVSSKTGRYGTDYLDRAIITAVGLGANLPQDAIYPTSIVNAEGKPYDGAKKYAMHFDKGELPPVNGFWSLTMYDAHYFFVANPLDRYTLGSRSKFAKNADGSIDLYIQHADPGSKREANWLPAPEGKFVLMLRMYWPKEKAPSILDGSWKVPPVKEARGTSN